jgi:putative hydrolase of HD superfamily
VNTPSILRLLDFYGRASQLKSIDRAGWRRCGIERGDCESVADHSFGVALLALLIPPDQIAGGERFDRDHCVALALVHDLAESIVGDITPHDGIEAADKHAREHDAIRTLSQTLGDEQLLKLWEEFEAATTPEARLVRDLDVIEMAIQAKSYERRGLLTAEHAAAFVESASRRITTPSGRAMLESVVSAG